MILATRGGNRELRFGENAARIPQWPDHASSASGQYVSSETATGLPAVGRAFRLVAGTTAAISIHVYEGEQGEKQERRTDWRARLLDSPVYGKSRFDWAWDIAMALEAVENAFLLKRKARGKVVELDPIPTNSVTGRIDRDGNKLFEVAGMGTLTTNDVLHIRGGGISGLPFGVSRIAQHRDPLGSMLAAQRFEGSYFRNHARPDVAIIFPAGVSRQQAEEWRPDWDAKYGGAENAGKAIPLGGGATITPIPLSLRDAQFIETRTLSVEDIGRICDVDPVLLGTEPRTDARQTAMNVFLRLQMPPRLRRITEALKADPDIFGPGTALYPEFHVDDLMFIDPLTRAQVEHERIQDGTALPDEIRAGRGEPPIPPYPADPSQTPGMVPLLTPVGAAPNPDPFPAGA